MKIVIDIDEELYSIIKGGYACEEDAEDVINLILKAFVLPKGHGRLIDANALDRAVSREWLQGSVKSQISSLIWKAPIIIEADKGDRE